MFTRGCPSRIFEHFLMSSQHYGNLAWTLYKHMNKIFFVILSKLILKSKKYSLAISWMYFFQLLNPENSADTHVVASSYYSTDIKRHTSSFYWLKDGANQIREACLESLNLFMGHEFQSSVGDLCTTSFSLCWCPTINCQSFSGLLGIPSSL